MAVEVTLYSKERCVQCTASERKLGAEKVEFIHANAVESIEYIQSLDKAYMQAPVMTVSVDGEVVDHWTGYRPDKIEALKTTYDLV